MPDTTTFVVNDRRKFTAEGELRHDGAPPAHPATAHPEEASATSPVSDDRTAAPILSFPQGTSTQTTAGHALDVSTPALDQLSDLPESGALAEPLAPGYIADSARADESASYDPQAAADAGFEDAGEDFPPGPTDEEASDALRAYEATVDRLDTALRAADPGADRLPPMSFERLIQSLYTQALMLLGGGTQPGEQPRVDILGARQTIDMLTVVADKTAGNLSPGEDKLMQSALFDLRMGFLEITQALARQAAQRQPGGPGSSASFAAPGAPGGPRIVR